MEGLITHNFKRKRGFTIIELMVVMSIMAVVSLLGLASIINVNNGVISDNISQGLLSQIRETQNKAFSVASDPADSSKFPMAWVVKIAPANDTSAGGVFSYYINAVVPGGGGDPTYTSTAYDEANYTSYPYKVDGVTVGGASTNDPVYLVFTTPFGAYIEATGVGGSLTHLNNPCIDNLGNAVCDQQESIPKSLFFIDSDGYTVDSGSKDVSVTISFRNSTRIITVSGNGEVNISG